MRGRTPNWLRLRRNGHAGRRRPRRGRPPALGASAADVVNIGRVRARCHRSGKGESRSAGSTHADNSGRPTPQLNPTVKSTMDSRDERKSVSLSFLGVTPRTRGMIMFLATLPVKVL